MISKETWVVYIAVCKNRAFYTGITNNLEKRLIAHNSGRGGKYTRSFRPVKLVWQEKHPEKQSAAKREIQIKKMKRKDKEILINRKR